MKILIKINIFEIVKQHFKTLENYNSKKIGFDDLFTFILLPVIISSILVYFEIDLKSNGINLLITTLSVLVGLLFNVIVIIFDIIRRENTEKIKNEILKQLLTNISYSIILSILIIILTLLSSIEFLHYLIIWIVYFLLSNYFMTVIMIIKRMYLLFIEEINTSNPN